MKNELNLLPKKGSEMNDVYVLHCILLKMFFKHLQALNK